MNRDLFKTIESVLAYIEVRLMQKIQLDELADIAHLSKYHLHRLISQVVGQPLINYIRARKLSVSIELLLESQYSVLDIANYFAFEHEQSYIRAFKKQFGLTPAQFRKVTPELLLTEKSDLLHLSKIYDGIIFKPLVKFMPIMPLNKPSVYQSEPFHYKSINEQISTEQYCEIEYYFPVQSLLAHSLLSGLSQDFC